jgi:hypothetical protein
LRLKRIYSVQLLMQNFKHEAKAFFFSSGSVSNVEKKKTVSRKDAKNEGVGGRV